MSSRILLQYLFLRIASGSFAFSDSGLLPGIFEPATRVPVTYGEGNAPMVEVQIGGQNLELIVDSLSPSLAVFVEESFGCPDNTTVACYSIRKSDTAKICFVQPDESSCIPGSSNQMDCRTPWLDKDAISNPKYGQSYTVPIDGKFYVEQGLEGLETISFTKLPSQSVFQNQAVRFVKSMSVEAARASHLSKAGGLFGLASASVGCRKSAECFWESVLSRFDRSELTILRLQRDNPSSNFIEFGSEFNLLGSILVNTAEHLHWAEKRQRDHYVNVARHEFLMYWPQLCGVDILSDVSSSWQVVIDTRSLGLTLPSFLYRRFMAQLDRISILKCPHESSSWDGETSSREDEEKPAGVPWVFHEGKIHKGDAYDSSFCHFRDPKLSHDEITRNLPTFSFQLTDVNEHASVSRIEIPLAKLVVKDNDTGNWILAVSEVQKQLIDDFRDSDGLEQVGGDVDVITEDNAFVERRQGLPSADMSLGHIGFGALVVSAFSGVVLDNRTLRVGFLVNSEEHSDTTNSDTTAAWETPFQQEPPDQEISDRVQFAENNLFRDNDVFKVVKDDGEDRETAIPSSSRTKIDSDALIGGLEQLLSASARRLSGHFFRDDSNAHRLPKPINPEHNIFAHVAASGVTNFVGNGVQYIVRYMQQLFNGGNSTIVETKLEGANKSDDTHVDKRTNDEKAKVQMQLSTTTETDSIVLLRDERTMVNEGAAFIQLPEEHLQKREPGIYSESGPREDSVEIVLDTNPSDMEAQLRKLRSHPRIRWPGLLRDAVATTGKGRKESQNGLHSNSNSLHSNVQADAAYCSAVVSCKFSQQFYSAPLNTCLDPVCEDRLFVRLNETTKECEIAFFTFPLLISLLVLLVIGEIFANHLYKSVVRMAAQGSSV